MMKITIIKLARKQQVLNRVELKDLAEIIKKSPDGKMERQVAVLRRNYQFYKPVRMEDGGYASPLSLTSTRRRRGCWTIMVWWLSR